jgi:hypothetical protein
MTARYAVVPFSAIQAEGLDLRASSYMQPVVEQEQRLACARKRYQQAITGLVNVAKQRREIKERQRRLGIVEGL